MNRRILFLAFVCVVPTLVSSSADIQLGGSTVIHFAVESEGRTMLAAKDDFIERLSQFDRSARMKVDRAVSEDEFMAFVGRNVVNWTKEEMQIVQVAVEAIQPLLRELPLSLPPIIQVIKTTGAEEGNAAYTRGTAIVLPKSELAKSQKKLERLICHELFHILSRQNRELREKLYQIIGFSQCDEIEFPPELKRRKITNPDAPRNDHFIRVKIDGHERLAVPVLLSSAEVYNVKRGGEFFEYLEFQFLVVERSSDPRRLKPVYEGSSPRLLGPQGISGFMEQIGRNTNYIIHPEEILADNFALLVLGEQNVASPEILQKMREVLMQKRKV